MEIRASVGAWEKGARNLKDDVMTVQQLLTRAAGQLGRPELDPRGIDGGIAKPPTKSDTVKAIKAFQSLVGIGPDGVIDPAGRTWQKLAGAENGVVEPPSAGEACFPFAKPAVAAWIHAPRAFGSNRSGGQRAHAGCDLYAPVGRTIYAVRDGVVMRDPYLFYAETDALEVDHGGFVIRYGEIKRGCALRKGDKVRLGQPIAQVGLLVGIGTLSGAPKIRALQIIYELEPAARGWYGGAVGYLGFDGAADFAICIRSLIATGDQLRIQAGAGLVFDSVPEAEDPECQAKASAVLRAIAMAQALRGAG